MRKSKQYKCCGKESIEKKVKGKGKIVHLQRVCEECGKILRSEEFVKTVKED